MIYKNIELQVENTRRPKVNKNMQFGAVADIFMAKMQDEILMACNVNQWDLYNSGFKIICIKCI